MEIKEESLALELGKLTEDVTEIHKFLSDRLSERDVAKDLLRFLTDNGKSGEYFSTINTIREFIKRLSESGLLARFIKGESISGEIDKLLNGESLKLKPDELDGGVKALFESLNKAGKLDELKQNIARIVHIQIMENLNEELSEIEKLLREKELKEPKLLELKHKIQASQSMMQLMEDYYGRASEADVFYEYVGKFGDTLKKFLTIIPNHHQSYGVYYTLPEEKVGHLLNSLKLKGIRPVETSRDGSKKWYSLSNMNGIEGVLKDKIVYVKFCIDGKQPQNILFSVSASAKNWTSGGLGASVGEAELTLKEFHQVMQYVKNKTEYKEFKELELIINQDHQISYGDRLYPKTDKDNGFRFFSSQATSSRYKRIEQEYMSEISKKPARKPLPKPSASVPPSKPSAPVLPSRPALVSTPAAGNMPEEQRKLLEDLLENIRLLREIDSDDQYLEKYEDTTQSFLKKQKLEKSDLEYLIKVIHSAYGFAESIGMGGSRDAGAASQVLIAEKVSDSLEKIEEKINSMLTELTSTSKPASARKPLPKPGVGGAPEASAARPSVPTSSPKKPLVPAHTSRPGVGGAPETSAARPSVSVPPLRPASRPPVPVELRKTVSRSAASAPTSEAVLTYTRSKKQWQHIGQQIETVLKTYEGEMTEDEKSFIEVAEFVIDSIQTNKKDPVSISVDYFNYYIMNGLLAIRTVQTRHSIKHSIEGEKGYSHYRINFFNNPTEPGKAIPPALLKGHDYTSQGGIPYRVIDPNTDKKKFIFIEVGPQVGAQIMVDEDDHSKVKIAKGTDETVLHLDIFAYSTKERTAGKNVEISESELFQILKYINDSNLITDPTGQESHRTLDVINDSSHIYGANKYVCASGAEEWRYTKRDECKDRMKEMLEEQDKKVVSSKPALTARHTPALPPRPTHTASKTASRPPVHVSPSGPLAPVSPSGSALRPGVEETCTTRSTGASTSPSRPTPKPPVPTTPKPSVTVLSSGSAHTPSKTASRPPVAVLSSRSAPRPGVRETSEADAAVVRAPAPISMMAASTSPLRSASKPSVAVKSEKTVSESEASGLSKRKQQLSGICNSIIKYNLIDSCENEADRKKLVELKSQIEGILERKEEPRTEELKRLAPAIKLYIRLANKKAIEVTHERDQPAGGKGKGDGGLSL